MEIGVLETPTLQGENHSEKMHFCFFLFSIVLSLELRCLSGNVGFCGSLNARILSLPAAATAATITPTSRPRRQLSLSLFNRSGFNCLKFRSITTEDSRRCSQSSRELARKQHPIILGKEPPPNPSGLGQHDGAKSTLCTQRVCF